MKLPVGPIRRAKLLPILSERAIAREYRPVLPGIYVRADQTIDFAMRSKALGVAYPEGVLAGWSAAALHGYRYLPENPLPEIILPRPAQRRSGVWIRYGELRADEVMDVYGYDVTTHTRTAYDLARRLDFDEAIALVDGLCHLALCDPKRILDSITPRARGIRRLPEIVELADAGAQSPWETRTRLLLMRAGFPRPITQHMFNGDNGQILAIVDMAWPEYRVALEYQGDHHRERVQYSKDVLRQNLLERLGWDVITATKELVTRYPDRLVERVAMALKRGGWAGSR
ncbi:DUF559 domain-containing protein [Skermania sp. ID1734]|uniref:DUF559 domain-containing protein n=1 Tax=Skermania sp. ID1734 TaxID=2597516 RepID=UPI00117F3BD7|nr:DUF559 domain-containing protein [Skermania sp. ID1734]TSE00464.1 DUF559 domain-containing protein [Skermania sp. ID1734]